MYLIFLLLFLNKANVNSIGKLYITIVFFSYENTKYK